MLIHHKFAEFKVEKIFQFPLGGQLKKHSNIAQVGPEITTSAQDTAENILSTEEASSDLAPVSTKVKLENILKSANNRGKNSRTNILTS